ncbi:carboxymuconolactone decarboxylase [Polynucleobacter sp. TUM22923]|jgi:alkylhydroperoxidase family enzyme|uniref:carboxymuconolactone decarboxylase family protein n=1 Tax=Polynucleobacter sp. TUM22923 TaxID=3022126 RepID=UPI00257416C4|nr:carboxymuconolactone decarboxylase family protein [Polynucleobacter sp. TUM22923]BDX21977.1 carboxymuconolactone decarboxylase [Polynucleobacter sp. TUM22923]
MNERLIPYQPMDLAEPAALVSAIRQRRGGQFINLDRMLLHSTPIAEGWNHFIGEIRNNLSLNPKLRELAMCGVAVLNGAEYEFFHHAPPFIQAGGTEEQVQALRLIGQANFPEECFSPIEQDTAALTFQMTRNIQVDSALMKRLQATLGNTDTVELVTVIAAYNMVSRFLIALDVNPEDHPPG